MAAPIAAPIVAPIPEFIPYQAGDEAAVELTFACGLGAGGQARAGAGLGAQGQARAGGEVGRGGLPRSPVRKFREGAGGRGAAALQAQGQAEGEAQGARGAQAAGGAREEGGARGAEGRAEGRAEGLASLTFQQWGKIKERVMAGGEEAGEGEDGGAVGEAGEGEAGGMGEVWNEEEEDRVADAEAAAAEQAAEIAARAERQARIQRLLLEVNLPRLAQWGGMGGAELSSGAGKALASSAPGGFFLGEKGTGGGGGGYSSGSGSSGVSSSSSIEGSGGSGGGSGGGGSGGGRAKGESLSVPVTPAGASRFDTVSNTVVVVRRVKSCVHFDSPHLPLPVALSSATASRARLNANIRHCFESTQLLSFKPLNSPLPPPVGLSYAAAYKLVSTPLHPNWDSSGIKNGFLDFPLPRPVALNSATASSTHLSAATPGTEF
ncbi:unnamed protein product [Closterium sp. Yama58-4]|nr:unnamed protein product [Closterium sp. Yama58-4]